jgi:hypothetical protein
MRRSPHLPGPAADDPRQLCQGQAAADRARLLSSAAATATTPVTARACSSESPLTPVPAVTYNAATWRIGRVSRAQPHRPRERTGSSPATMPDTPPPRARGAVERPGGERCRSGGPSGPARRERSVSITWNLGPGKPSVVGRRRPPAGGRSGCPRPRAGLRLVGRGPADRDRSVFPVPVAADIGVGLDGAEDRQQISERPARVAHARPLVTVLWPSSQREAGVGRRAAADQAPPRQRNRTPALV